MKLLHLLLLIISFSEWSVAIDSYNSLLNFFKIKAALLGNQELLDDIEEYICDENRCFPGRCVDSAERKICICPSGYEYKNGRCIVRKCFSPFRCWPGTCVALRDQEYCLCPGGFFSKHGSCVSGKQLSCISNTKRKCQRKDCYPGLCTLKEGKEICLCPEGYYSERGICKALKWKCKATNCRPGKCLEEFKEEKCLCPQGYTAKPGKCVELSVTSAGKISTILLMIIVSVASIMLTTFIGVSICYCYYCRQGNYAT